MALRIYNTLTRQKEEFKPIKKNRASFYHCGPTVYWTQHLGNLRGMFCADSIVRTLKYLGYQVKHVRNYTDVGHLTDDQDQGEDKIEKSAKKEKLTPRQIADKYIQIFERDTKKLNLMEPDIKPRATECLPEIIGTVQTLIDKGFAYTTPLAVYFDISQAKNYTQLSKQPIEDKLKGAGKGESSDPDKKHPADFALWFFKAGKHKNALQYWKSPFESPLVKKGCGFPGWHIECSVMSNKYLGETIDIHMGGVEHIPVHHTNEIAQSEAANGVKFVNYWLHNEHLLFNQQKISKSEGQTLTLDDLINKGFDPLAFRFLMLQSHYRSKQNFTWETIQAAQAGYDKLKEEYFNLGKEKGKIIQELKDEFIQKISNDFNLAQGLAATQQLIKSEFPKPDILATLLDFDKVLGLNLNQLTKDQTIPEEIQNLAKQREQARKNKEWDKADQIRKQIQKQGYQIEDFKKGYKLKIKK